MIGKVFNYIKPLWEGEDGKISLKASVTLVLLWNFVENINWAIHKWEAGRSFEGLSLLLTTEAGLMAAAMGITSWSNMTAKKIDAIAIAPPPLPNITVQRAENVTGGTKAETVNAQNVDTVNTQTTNVGRQDNSQPLSTSKDPVQ